MWAVSAQKIFLRLLSDHAVTVCDNGKQAVDAFLANPGGFDVLLTDVQMCGSKFGSTSCYFCCNIAFLFAGR